MANVPFKPITSIISTKQEKATFTTTNDSGLTYTFCDRTNLTSKEANYFASFRLPFNDYNLLTTSPLSLQQPEIQQLNVDNIVIASIPASKYNEIIDGRSITFTVPQLSGATAMSSMTVVSSTYSQLTKSQNSTLLGNNIAFLFADDINLPRTGSTNGGQVVGTGRTTWDVSPSPFINRPQAHAYSDLDSNDLNTDQRPWGDVNLAVSVSELYPSNTNRGYNYDVPVGFVALDKGFMVLTHPDVVDNIPWNQGYQLHSNIANSGSDSGTTNVYFSDTSVSQATFNDIDISFRTSVVCLALPTEFVFSSNLSWNLPFNLQELDNETHGYQSIYITEIGLYNRNDELIAIAKTDRPVEKNYTNLITFNLDIDV